MTSPTFTIARRYDGAVPVSHLDLYRLGDLADEDPALLADELGPDRVAFVEWPEVGSPVGLDAERVVAQVRLEHRGGDRRLVVVRERPPPPRRDRARPGYGHARDRRRAARRRPSAGRRRAPP